MDMSYQADSFAALPIIFYCCPGSNYCCPCKTCEFAQMGGFPAGTVGRRTAQLLTCCLHNFTIAELHCIFCTVHSFVQKVQQCRKVAHKGELTKGGWVVGWSLGGGGGERSAHKEAFSLLSPLTLPLLPAMYSGTPDKLLLFTEFQKKCTSMNTI